MNKYYRDYYWKKGTPQGKGLLDEKELHKQESYKIVIDPYRKRISIENYINGKFKAVIYDSILLDFRRLNPIDQMAWQKTTMEETPDQTTCLIRNQEDRVILIETHFFEQNLCRRSQSYSPQGILVSFQRMYYKALQDPFNGVILFDQNSHPVMFKRYHVNDETGEFTDLLEENTCMNSDFLNVPLSLPVPFTPVPFFRTQDPNDKRH